MGTGPLAVKLRGRLGENRPPADERPRTVVDTSGELGVLKRLLERVDDLGTVVLASPPPLEGAAIDLYVRGLTVVSVEPAREESA